MAEKKQYSDRTTRRNRPIDRVRAALVRLSRDRWICPAELNALVHRFSILACSQAPSCVYSRAFALEERQVGLYQGDPLVWRDDSPNLYEVVHRAIRNHGVGFRHVFVKNKTIRLKNGMPIEFIVLQALAKERKRYSYGK